jgi:hypothetical protein
MDGEKAAKCRSYAAHGWCTHYEPCADAHGDKGLGTMRLRG